MENPYNPTYQETYRRQRRFIGFTGLLLPWVVYVGGYLSCETELQDSISAYYHHVYMGSVFSSMLCVIGVFMLFYRGHDWMDNWAGNLAFVFAVATAFFPTIKGDAADTWTSWVHYVSAGILFSILTVFSLYLFAKSGSAKRKRVYYTCGIVMLLCLFVIVIRLFLSENTKESWDNRNAIFWLEAITVEAFGISWLTKGHALFKDRVPKMMSK